MTQLLKFLFPLLLSTGLYASPQSVTIAFYSENLTIPFDSDMKLNTTVRVQDQVLVRYFKQMEATNYSLLLDHLLLLQGEKDLNDWLFYELMQESVDQILEGKTKLRKQLTLWFLLSKVGFDTRLTYLNKEVFVYVHTDEELFEVPIIEADGRNFANLTSIKNKKRRREALYMLDFKPNRAGRPFKFYLKRLPKLKELPQEKVLEFSVENQRYQLKMETDATAKMLMRTYPLMHESQYLQVPFSKLTEASLLPKLKRLISKQSAEDAIKILISFTRSSFAYKEDKSFFGYSKPMIPEEVFLYPYSDCEDRVALMYAMVKKLLKLPMVVIAYEDHLTLAISIPGMRGDAVQYKGKKFFFCDPTGPIDSSEIGRIPYGYEEQGFEIIAAYLPKNP
ncbi:MAG: hypothetical protein AAF798_04175 [Bacteroidota bacterium]